MQELFRRETMHAKRLYSLYETLALTNTSPRAQEKIAEIAREDISYWKKLLLSAQDIDALVERHFPGTQTNLNQCAQNERRELFEQYSQLETYLNRK